MKTTVSGMHGELVEMLNGAETSGIENTEGVLREDQFVGAKRERCMKASREMYSVLARYTSSEASTSGSFEESGAALVEDCSCVADCKNRETEPLGR